MADETDYTDNGLLPDNVFMSKRLQVAAMMAQGLVSHYGISVQLCDVAEDALSLADELIRQENIEEN